MLHRPPHRSNRLACALAIGGLDPGGGAGIAADLRAITATGAFGCAALAAITVQSTAGLRSVRGVPARELSAQVTEVMKSQRVASVKVGALGNAANVRVVAALLARFAHIPVVVDTPMAPTRGKGRLLPSTAVRRVRDELVPRATVLTANVDEVFALTGERVRTVSEAHDAARALCALGARAVLVKGGHLSGPDAIDVLAIDGEAIELRARRLAIPPTHGTGCTFASLVAGRLAARSASASGEGSRASIVDAIRWAKRFHHTALARTADVGRGLRVVVFEKRA
jgi:hydroxymethylpyrimidine/phosphomethylpyrimidine kinase